MFQILKVDGPNILTNRGGVALVPFQYADSDEARPVGNEDWRRMRDLFLAGPEMLAALHTTLGFLCVMGRVQNVMAPGHESPTMATLRKIVRGAMTKAGTPAEAFSPAALEHAANDFLAKIDG